MSKKKNRREKKKNLTKKMQTKIMSLLNEIQILLRSHQSFYTSFTWDDEVYDDFLTLQNNGSTWLRPFSYTAYSIPSIILCIT